MKNMVTKKSWKEFRSTGLLLFINQILHVFGWAFVFEIDDSTKEIITVYPARVDFRGFDNNHISEEYKKITNYLKDNIDDLKSEVDL
jgi:hypothetical protein